MIPEQMLEKIRKLCKDLDGLSQESFAKGIKMYAAIKAESQTLKVSGGISKKEYDRLSEIPEYCEATEIIADTLTLLEALDNLEWVYNDLIRKLYHIRPEIPQAPDDEENVYSLEPPFTRSKFLN